MVIFSMNSLLFLLNLYIFVFNIEPVQALKLKPHLSREGLTEYTRAKGQKYHHLSRYEELSLKSRSLLKSIDSLMRINIIRCDKESITDKKLKKVLTESFNYINETLSPARQE